MRNLLIVFCLGVGMGLFGAQWLQTPRFAERVRHDGVTLKREELLHLQRAIEMLGLEKAPERYTRYESDSGTFAFECPTAAECNLFVLARDAAVHEKFRSGQAAPTRALMHQIYPRVEMNTVLQEAKPIPTPASGIYQQLEIKKVEAISAP